MSEKDELPWKRGQRYAACGESDSVGISNPKISYYEVPEAEARELWNRRLHTPGDFTIELDPGVYQSKYTGHKITVIDRSKLQEENTSLKGEITRLLDLLKRIVIKKDHLARLEAEKLFKKKKRKTQHG